MKNPLRPLIDSCARLLKVSQRFVPLVAVASLLLGATSASAALRPGLQYGYVTNANSIVDGLYPAVTNSALSILHAKSGTPWGAYVVWVYWGQIYLDGSTYRFGENIDDQAKLTIDGEVILDDKQWGVPTFGSITRPAGWYDFEVRFQNGGDPGGPVANVEKGFTLDKGFCYTKGTAEEVGNLSNALTFVLPADPGDRTIFRHEDGKLEGGTLRVVASPEAFGEVTPPYGNLDNLKKGTTVSCSAPASVDVDGAAYRLEGYDVYDLDPLTFDRTGLAFSGKERSFEYVHGGSSRELEWKWALDSVAISIASAGYGTVSTTGGLYAAGQQVEVTAVPSASYAFSHWEGDLDEALRFQSSISFPASKPLALKACFSSAYYVATDGDDKNAGRAPADAFLTIAHAIKVVPEGAMIFVAEGTYPITSTLEIRKGITIRGAGADKTIVEAPFGKTGRNGWRVVLMDHKDAILEGMTLTGGCPNNQNYEGVGVRIEGKGGTVARCRITGNRSTTYYTHGAVWMGSDAARLIGCEVDHNDLSTPEPMNCRGAGVYLEKGLVENCLIHANRAATGGGVYMAFRGHIRGCTIADNSSLEGVGGGLYWSAAPNDTQASLYNTIIVGNHSANDPGAGSPEWNTPHGGAYNSLMVCSKGVLVGPKAAPLGADGLVGDPVFKDPASGDYSLLASSPAIDRGVSYGGMAPFDLAGGARVRGQSVDLGCHEYDQDLLACSLVADRKALFENETVVLRASVSGTAAVPVCRWTLVSDQGETLTFEGQTIEPPIAKAGWYDVTLAVTDPSFAAPLTHSRARYLHVVPRTTYLAAPGESTPAYPWSTPETASDDLLELVAEAIDGSEIIAAEGLMPVSATVLVDKAIKIHGAGMDKTVFSPADSMVRVRLFHLNAPGALLEGVTVKGSRHRGNRYDRGTAVLIGGRGGTLLASRVTGTWGLSYDRCGAVALTGPEALVSRCIINANTNVENACHGGGVFMTDGTVENSLIYGNRGYDGGGIFFNDKGRVLNCTITDNTAVKERGGGVHWNSWQTPETALLCNTIVAGNHAPNDGTSGSPDWSTHPHDRAVASAKACLRNLLVGAGVPTVGTNGVSGNPVFADPSKEDYSLLPASPAIDAGVSYEGMAAVDLAGAARVKGEAVDIGCHEFDPDALSCALTITRTAIFENESIVLSATVSGGAPVDPRFSWTLADEKGETLSAEGVKAEVPVPKPGWYDVTLTITDSSFAGPLTLVRPRLLHVVPRTLYLAAPGDSSPAYPWSTPETAADDLAELIPETIDGSEIIAFEGEMPLGGTISLEKGVALRGAGIDKTVFVPRAANVEKRLFYISHPQALVQGVTIKGSHHRGERYEHGIAVLFGGRGGTLLESRVTATRSPAYDRFGAISLEGPDALVSRCVIDANTNVMESCEANAVAIYGGRIENSLICKNVGANHRGTIYAQGAGSIVNCTVADNVTLGQDLRGNKANGVGGIYIQFGQWDPGVHVVNTIFSGNTASNENKSAGCPEWQTSVHKDRESPTTNCLFHGSAPLSAFDLTGDPLFKDRAAGDYRISRNSPAYDAGRFYDWMADDVDLAGAPRVDHKERVDIGCYEIKYAPSATMLILR